MNTSEPEAKIEKSAKELLWSLQTECPEKVWQELNYELEQGSNGSGESNLWINRKFLLLAASVVLIAIAAVLLIVHYTSGRNNIPAPEVKDSPPPQSVVSAPLIQQKPVQPAHTQPIATRDTSAPITNQQVSISRADTAKRDTGKAHRARLVTVPPKSLTHKDSVAKDTIAKRKEELRIKRKEEYAMKRRNRQHADANDTLNSHFYHMVNKEPFPADSGQ